MSEPEVYRRKREVTAGDIDFLGHVNNVVWLRWVVEIAEQHAVSHEAGSRIVRERGGQWIVCRHELDYHANAELGEPVVCETWVESMRGARSLRRARFTRPDGTLLVSSLTPWAFVDATTLRPKRIPRELLQVFGYA